MIRKRVNHGSIKISNQADAFVAVQSLNNKPHRAKETSKSPNKVMQAPSPIILKSIQLKNRASDKAGIRKMTPPKLKKVPSKKLKTTVKFKVSVESNSSAKKRPLGISEERVI